jgi:hypothetical protein
VTRFLAFVGLLVLFHTPPARAQGNVPRINFVSGSVNFPAVTLTGDVVTSNATLSPSFSVRDGGALKGWNVTFQASALANGGASIPASNLSFTASGGTLSPPDANVLESGASGSLNLPLKVLYVNSGAGGGPYTYTPLATNFMVDIPATALAGTYSGTLTATISTGP